MTPAEIAEFRSFQKSLHILVVMNARDEPMTIAEIIEITGEHHETTAIHLRALRRQKRVRRSRGGPWYLTPRGREILPGMPVFLSTAYPQNFGVSPQQNLPKSTMFAENPRSLAENPRMAQIFIHSEPDSGPQTGQPVDNSKSAVAENPRSLAENPRSLAENPRENFSTGPTKTTIKDLSYASDQLILLARAITQIDGTCPYKTALAAVNTAFDDGESTTEIAQQIQAWHGYCLENHIPEISRAVAANILTGDKIYPESAT